MLEVEGLARHAAQFERREFGGWIAADQQHTAAQSGLPQQLEHAQAAHATEIDIADQQYRPTIAARCDMAQVVFSLSEA